MFWDKSGVLPTTEMLLTLVLQINNTLYISLSLAAADTFSLFFLGLGLFLFALLPRFGVFVEAPCLYLFIEALRYGSFLPIPMSDVDSPTVVLVRWFLVEYEVKNESGYENEGLKCEFSILLFKTKNFSLSDFGD